MGKICRRRLFYQVGHLVGIHVLRRVVICYLKVQTKWTKLLANNVDYFSSKFADSDLVFLKKMIQTRVLIHSGML